VELRAPLPGGAGRRRGGPATASTPVRADRTGTLVRLAGATLRVDASYPRPGVADSRLWSGELATPEPLLDWLTANGGPIRYPYVSAPWPLSAYRTPYADTPGSAEMPSAGRALTGPVLRRLRGRGVQVAHLVLHCGVSSPEAHEPPFAEWYSVPESTARAVGEARRQGRRVVAVGTTVVRALETTGGLAGSGWTDLVVTPDRGVSTVDGVLTGWHEPQGSHLLLLRALAGPDLLAASYRAALDAGYLWHEFGDLHLVLPS
jgi:S-adenosylmethionine:tRNA ribosyltransferase-isomerase